MKKIELLSPAGNMECLKAAIEAGCDAVYLSGILFGARSFAGNFSDDELIEAIKYSHLYGVKVYVAINTIVYDRQVDKFIEFVRFLHMNNVDSVIMQDIGMLDLVRKKFPNLEIHASTQMHIHNLSGALLAQKLGIKRVVLARETSIDDIKNIKEKTNIDIEVFIHGALCISYSGQCLMSALIGNRSGNKGTCAQVCRKKYELYNENMKKVSEDNYLLSTKDLCTLENIDKIIESGACSLKIEGRMKRKEYVYLVTKIYRKVIDSYYENKKCNISYDDIKDLKKMFNRKFTKGYILNEKNENIVYQKRPNHIGIEVGSVINYKNRYLKIKLTDRVNVHDGLRIVSEKEDYGLIINKMFINDKEVLSADKGDIIKIKYDKNIKEKSKVLLTSSYNQLNEINLNLNNLKRKVLIDVNAIIKVNDYIYMEAKCLDKIVSIKSSFIVSKAINRPISKDEVIKQLNKTNNTVYKINNINIKMDNNCFINIKDINELRRELLSKLDEKRLYNIPFYEKEYKIEVPEFNRQKKKSILLNTKKDYIENKDKYDLIYTSNIDLLKYKDIIYKVPRVINEYPKINNRVLIGELGGINAYTNFDTDFSFNVVNSYAIAFLHSIGAKKVTLSYELNLSQIKNLIDSYVRRYKTYPNCEVIIDSYAEAMVSKFDLNKMYKINKGYLKDQYGNYYKIISNNNYMTIYDYKKTNIENEEEYYDVGCNYIRRNID